MAADDGRSRLGSFLLGSLMGGLAAVAASRLGSRRTQRSTAAGGLGDLRPFEAAPCFDEQRPEPPDAPRARPHQRLDVN